MTDVMFLHCGWISPVITMHCSHFPRKIECDSLLVLLYLSLFVLKKVLCSSCHYESYVPSMTRSCHVTVIFHERMPSHCECISVLNYHVAHYGPPPRKGERSFPIELCDRRLGGQLGRKYQEVTAWSCRNAVLLMLKTLMSCSMKKIYQEKSTTNKHLRHVCSDNSYLEQSFCVKDHIECSFDGVYPLSRSCVQECGQLVFWSP